MTAKVDSPYRKWSCSNKFLHEMHFITYIYTQCALYTLRNSIFFIVTPIFCIHFHTFSRKPILTTFFVVSTHTAPTLFFSCFVLELQHYAVYLCFVHVDILTNVNVVLLWWVNLLHFSVYNKNKVNKHVNKVNRKDRGRSRIPNDWNFKYVWKCFCSI